LRRELTWVSGATIILLVLSISSTPGVFASATVEPGYTLCCAHGPIPTSISGIIDTYEFLVMNTRNVSIIQVFVYIPADFGFVNASATGSAWRMERLGAPAGGLSGVSWNGGVISPKASSSFSLTLRNPEVGLRFSGVYTFIIVQVSVGGVADAARTPVEITQPNRIFGIDAPFLALASLGTLIGLLLVETVFPVKKTTNG